ncbi:MAG TPA: NPCBM/NEW2 domain-containing protein [Gemmataceae bacterium]|nr:NPCBM/NEW2 domain-containing protein [Gemmataceae bacterium]
MRVRAALLALFLCTSISWGAKLQTLKGDVLEGNIESITDKEIVLSQGAKRVTTPLAQVLKIDFTPAPVKLPEKYADVELTDGSLLHCQEWSIKAKQVELKTLAGQEIKLPLSALANLLIHAGDEKYRKDWKERLAKKRRRDVIAILDEGTVNPVEGTLGLADENGKTIEFQLTSGKKRAIPLSNPNLHGFIFQRELDPQAPPVLCKLTDNHQDFIMASAVARTPTGLSVTTPAGARIEVALDLVARLDYTLDKLAYLSRLEPVKVVQTSNFDFIDTYRRDKNLDNGPLRLYDESYALGLALHAHTELEYDLKGDYREFHALAGIDQAVGGVGGPVVLVIEGVIDGQAKELYKKTFTRKDSRVKSEGVVNLNIKDVQKLRIIVRSGDMFDNGKHLDLVNAKVQK